MTRLLPILRHSAKWLALAVLVMVLVYRMNFAPVAVLGHTVCAGPLIAEVLGTGTLEARVKTTITPRIQERLAAAMVDQGDMVTQGQVLAQLDDGESQRLVDVAQATLAAASATAARVQVDEARAQAVERQARRDHERIANLLSTKVSSQADFDKSREQLDLAEVDLKRVRAATIEAQRQVTLAEKNLAHQQERLTFTRIVSPYDGLIVRRDRDPGGVVVPGSSLLQLVATNELWIAAWVDETSIAALATGQPARVVFRSDPAVTYPGRVARLGRETDRETREFVVDVRLARLPKNWMVGQRAEAYIETGRASTALVVPQRFVQWHGDAPGVFINQRGRAVWRAITLGLRGRDAVEATHGLAAGTQIVLPRDPKQELTDGQRITVQ